MRNVIKKGLEFTHAIPYLFPEIKTIKRASLRQLYNHKEDIILVRSHNLNDLYNEIFKDKEKYKVLEQKKGLYNGSIVFEKPEGVRAEFRHGYTIHSVQGETYEGKIFIDIRGMNKKDSISKTADKETQTDLDMNNMRVKQDTTAKGKRIYRVDENPYNKLQYHKGYFHLTFD